MDVYEEKYTSPYKKKRMQFTNLQFLQFVHAQFYISSEIYIILFIDLFIYYTFSFYFIIYFSSFIHHIICLC